MESQAKAVSLTRVWNAFEDDLYESDWYVNKETGDVRCHFETDTSEIEDDEFAFEGPEWIYIDSRRKVDDWELMRDFAYGIKCSETDTLLDAIRGKGAFRAFRNRIERIGALKSWLAYKNSCYIQAARDWLEEHGLAYEDDVHDNFKQDWKSLLPQNLRMTITMRTIDAPMSVCKVEELPAELLGAKYCFTAKTPSELSVVCETSLVPPAAIAREDGWRALEVSGPLDFALVGILAKITGALADADVPVFAVSTFDTDYVLVKEENLDRAIDALTSSRITVA